MTTETPTTHSQPKPRVRRGSKPYVFHIESKTRPGRFHVADAHHLTCSCEAGRAGRGCWHLRLALAAYDWIKRQQAERAARRHAERVACTCATDAVQRAGAPVPPAPVPVPHAPLAVAEAGMRRLQEAFE